MPASLRAWIFSSVERVRAPLAVPIATSPLKIISSFDAVVEGCSVVGTSAVVVVVSFMIGVVFGCSVVDTVVVSMDDRRALFVSSSTIWISYCSYGYDCSSVVASIVSIFVMMLVPVLVRLS